MHEMSIAESLIELIEEECQRQGFTHVSRVSVRIGMLSAVEPDALIFCFDAAATGGIAQGAGLVLITVPGEGYCMRCQRTVALTERYMPCPTCGEHVRLTAGDELRLAELEVE